MRSAADSVWAGVGILAFMFVWTAGMAILQEVRVASWTAVACVVCSGIGYGTCRSPQQFFEKRRG